MSIPPELALTQSRTPGPADEDGVAAQDRWAVFGQARNLDTQQPRPRVAVEGDPLHVKRPDVHLHLKQLEPKQLLEVGVIAYNAALPDLLGREPQGLLRPAGPQFLLQCAHIVSPRSVVEPVPPYGL